MSSVKILEKIGSGQYGHIHVAEYNGKKVACKKLEDGNEYNQVTCDKIRELLVFSLTSKSKYTPKHYGFILKKHHMSIIMELYHCTLWDISDPEMLQELTPQCEKGLKYLHSLHIVHCDVKPQNFLVDMEKMQVVIADFGLSSPNPDTGSEVTYTSTYRSPSVWQKNRATFADDYWALGVSMIDMALRDCIFDKIRKLSDFRKYKHEYSEIIRKSIKKIPEEFDLNYTQTVYFLTHENPNRRGALPQKTLYISNGDYPFGTAEAQCLFDSLNKNTKFLSKYDEEDILKACLCITTNLLDIYGEDEDDNVDIILDILKQTKGKIWNSDWYTIGDYEDDHLMYTEE